MSNSNDERPVTMTSGVARLKDDSQASMAELRDFLGEMKGKSATEMLGSVAQSHLARAMFLAVLSMSVFLVVFTVVPAMFAEKEAQGTLCLNKACNKLVTMKGFRFCPHCGTRKGDNFPPSAGGVAAATKVEAKSEAAGSSKEDRMAQAAKAMKIDEVKKGTPRDIENLLDVELDK